MFAAIFLFPLLSASYQVEPFYLANNYLYYVGRDFELKLEGIKARTAR